VTVPAQDGNGRSQAEHWYATGVYGHLTLPQAVLAASSAQPDLPIVFHSAAHRTTLTLEELVDRAGRCAAAFRSLGAGPGDAVAVQVPSWAEGAIAQAAALLAWWNRQVGRAEHRCSTIHLYVGGRAADPAPGRQPRNII
jgi:non-ribosomal peptide synthetase component E (peptide arylation enzyme)